MRKTWREKFYSPHPPTVAVVDRPMLGIPTGARMLVANPATVQKFVASIPKGRSKTIPELRAAMAAQFGADTTCPLTTGIFLRIVSECALEDMASGRPVSEVTPFWRAVDPKSGVAKKLSCGVARLEELRRAEGL
jgi:hypothetical protein